MASAGTSTDVIIVGSGHNGLVAAVTLAAAGKRVLVLEGQPYPGGATVSARIFPEYDAQISRYSYLISLFSEQLADDLGLQLKCQRRKVASFTPWQNQRGEQRGLLISNDDEARTRKSLRTLCGTDDAWQSLQRFEELRQEFSRLVWPTMLQPLQSRSTFEKQLVTAPQRAAWEAFVERPLGEYLEQNFANDLVRGLLMTDGRIGLSVDAHDPTLLQNRCFIYHVIGNLTGEWRVPTGG
ncbi:MAG: FAD-dependent oxidoreductase, partial [Planctomycetaceae bacterium]